MKRIKYSWVGSERETVRDRIKVAFEKCGRRLSERFQRWCLSVPPRRLKIYALLLGVLVTALTIVSLRLGFSHKSEADLGRLIIPAHLRVESAEQENASRRADRSRIELETLIDSLKRDSVGQLILDSMIKEGRVKFDSSVMR